MSLTPIREARSALAAAGRACIAAARADMTYPAVVAPALIESIHRFVRTVEGNVHLSRVAHDGTQAYHQEVAPLTAEKVRLWTALQEIRREAEQGFPILSSGPLAPLLGTGNRRPLDHFDAVVAQMLREPTEVDEGDLDDLSAGCVEPADILWEIVTDGLDALGVPPNTPGIMRMRGATESTRNDLTTVRTSCLLINRVHPTAKWHWLRQIMSRSNPVVGSLDWHLLEARVGEVHLYRKVLFDPTHFDTDELSWLEQFRLRVIGAVTAVESDFQARLGDRASLVWLLRRYARRCRWLRLDELQQAVAACPTPQKEPTLTRDAATYLFDQGLDVLTEQSLGQNRYDVIGTTLLLEGKTCSASKPPLRAVVDGLVQLASYEAQLRAEGLALEPVLVVFCLGGRTPRLPDSYKIGNLDVAILLVDLATSSQRGHKAAPPVLVTVEGIAAEIERLAQKKSKRGVRRR